MGILRARGMHSSYTGMVDSTPPRFFRRIKPHALRLRKSAFCWPAMLPLIIIGVILANWVFLAQRVYAAPLAPTAQSGHLTFQQYSQEGQQNKASKNAFTRPAEEKQKAPHAKQPTLPGAEPATMEPMSTVLTSAQTAASQVRASGVKPLDFVGSDSRFEMQVPSGAFDLSQAKTNAGTVPSGTLTRYISQGQAHSFGLVNRW